VWFTNHCSWLENIASLFLGAVNNTISGHPISPLSFLCFGVCHGDAFPVMVVAHGAVATSLYGFFASGLWIFDHQILLKDNKKANTLREVWSTIIFLIRLGQQADNPGTIAPRLFRLPSYIAGAGHSLDT